MIELDLEAQGIQSAILDLQATEAQVAKALNSTLGKMAAWMRSRSVKGLSSELQVQQKIIRRRLKSFRMKRTADGSSITVWYGLDPIALIYLGARQTKQGVVAGKHKVDGAFIRTGRNGSRQVFKRRGAARLPLDKQRLDIEDKANTYLEDKVIGDVAFETQFQKTFEHELQWRTRTQK
ncbi:hypothetical protein C4E04_11925 [Microvirga sp. 17 mud 1-3]|nr:hypothetical protein C4E04_11925 [Microvirga sp. 17 mud 1-3]